MIDPIGQDRTFDAGHLLAGYPVEKGLNVQIQISLIELLVDGPLQI